MGVGYDPATKNAHYDDNASSVVINVESEESESEDDLDQGVN